MIEDEVLEAILSELEGMDGAVPRYADQLPEGVAGPAFVVVLLGSSQTMEVSRRSKRKLIIDVRFHPAPDSANKQADCRAMADRLYAALDTVEVDDRQIRTTGGHYELVDGVLHFGFNVDLFLMKEKPLQDKMQSMIQEETIR